MTTVDDFGEYTGVMGTVSVGGTVLADVEYDVSWETETVSGTRASKYSDVNIPGKRKVTTTLKKSLVREDAPIVIGMSLNATPTSGTAGVVLAATAPGAADAWFPAAITIATPSRIRITCDTAAITTAGTMTVIGTDVNGSPLQEQFTITTLGIGEYVTGSKLFKSVIGIANVATRSTSGKFKVDSIAGASSYTFGPPAIFEVIGTVTKGAHTIVITQPDCWFKKGGLAWGDAGKIIEVDLPVEMHDPDLLTAVIT